MLALKLFQRQNVLLKRSYVFEQYKISPLVRNLNVSGPKWLSAKGEATHKPNQLEKYLLVWMKRYPSVAEVPNVVSPYVMERVRNQARIKITIIMMFFTAFICLIMIYSGKKAAQRGESVRKMNVDWHKEQDAKE